MMNAAMKWILTAAVLVAAALFNIAIAAEAVPPGAITRLVLDAETRKPVAGAEVRVYQVDLTGTEADFAAPLTTGKSQADGTVVIALDPPEAKHRFMNLIVDAPGYGQVLSHANSPSSPDSDSEWWYDPEILLHRTAVLELFVVDETGAPIPDVRLDGRALWRVTSRINGFQPMVLPKSVTVAADGTMRFEGMEVGQSYTLTLRARGYLPLSVREAPAGAKALRCVMRKATASARFRVLHPDGTPIKGAFLQIKQIASSTQRLEDLAPEIILGKSKDTQPDADGFFHTSDLASEKYSIRAILPVNPPWPMVIEMEKTFAAGDNGLVTLQDQEFDWLEGIAIDDETSKPLAGATVIAGTYGDLFGNASTEDLRKSPKVPPESKVITGPDGKFRVRFAGKLDESRSQITVYGPDGFAPRTNWFQVRGKEMGIGVFGWFKPGDTVRIRFARALRIKGRVVDKATQLPVKGVQLSQGTLTLNLEQPDDQGLFEFDAIPGTLFSLEAKAGDKGASTERMKATKALQQSGILLQLEAFASFSGTVLVNGAPKLNQFMVSTQTDPPTQFGGRRPRVSSTGEYHLRWVKPGNLTITASGINKDEYVPTAPRQITLKPGEHLTGVDFNLEPTVALTGTVKNEAGMPISEVTVTAKGIDGDPEFSESVRTDAEGKFSIGGFKAGTTIAEIRTFFPGFVYEWAELKSVKVDDSPIAICLLKWDQERQFARMRPPEPTPVPTPFIPLGNETIRGRVLGFDGKPSAGAVVTYEQSIDAQQGPALRLKAKTDAAGEFTIAGAKPGRHYLRATIAREAVVDEPAPTTTDTEPSGEPDEITIYDQPINAGEPLVVTFDFSKHISVRGKVTVNGKPLASHEPRLRGTIKLENPNPKEMIPIYWIGDHTRFALTLRPESHLVRLSDHPNYQTSRPAGGNFLGFSKRLDLTSAKGNLDLKIDFRVGSLKVVSVFPEGIESEPVTIRMISVDHPEYLEATATTSHALTFECTYTPVGKWRIEPRYTTMPFTWEPFEVEVKEGQLTEVKLVLIPNPKHIK